MELENEGPDNLMNQQSKEQNNEDLGQPENETETNVAMEQERIQVIENSKQSQAQNRIIFSNQSSDILQHSQNRPTGDRWLKF